MEMSVDIQCLLEPNWYLVSVYMYVCWFCKSQEIAQPNIFPLEENVQFWPH